MNTAHRAGAWRLPPSLLSIGLLALASACPGDPPPTPAPASAPPEHRFDEPDCASLEGSAPTDERAAAEGVASIGYRVAQDGALVELDALDAEGAPLGAATIRYHAELAATPTWTTTIEYQEGSALARQTTSAVPLGGGLVRHTTVHELGEARSFVWWTMSLQGELRSMTVGAPTSDAPGEGVVRLLEGSFRTLELVKDGARVADAAQTAAFTAAHGLGVFDESATYRRLGSVVDDPGWLSRLAPSALACASLAAGAREGELSIGPASPTALVCDKDRNLFGDVLAAESALGLVNTAAAFTLGLAAIGAVTTAAGAVAVFGATVVALYAAGKLIDWIAANRFGNIVAAPAIHAGDEETAAAVKDFFGAKGSSAGDPHLVTHDGEAFDLQSAGEFVLVRGTSSSFELQVRQGPRDALCADVSFNHAIAARLGAHRVSYDPSRARPLWVDGVDLDLLDGVLLLSDGGKLLGGPGELQLVAASGESVLVLGGAQAMSLFVDVPAARAGTYQGVLGNADGARGNDFIDVQGQLLPRPPTWEALHGGFADAWRVDADTSLFDYPAGEGPESFLVPDFPSGPVSLEGLDPAQRAAAAAACASVTNPTAFDDCVLDVACTGDDSFVAIHALRRPASRTPVLSPVPLEGWTQQGPPGNGTWQPGADTRSVTLVSSSGPTFFVSPGEYQDVRVDFTLNGPINYQEVVGMVFGYQSPVAAEGEASTAVDSFVLTWKRNFNDLPDGGLQLLHVHGDLAIDGADALLRDANAAGRVDVLASDLGLDRGWRTQPYRISLLYTAERIEIWIDGAQRFAVTAAQSPRPFEPGRIGFYGDGQPSVLFADVTLGPPSAVPYRADCTAQYRHADSNWITQDTTIGQGCTRVVITGGRDLIAQQGVLTILPGTTVLFDAGLTFEVWTEGALVAEGTAEEPIHIGGTEAVVGHWGGLSFASASPLNTLKHVTLSDTGASGWQFNRWGLTMSGSAAGVSSLALEDCTFLRHGDDAVHIFPGAELRSFARNTFDDCEDLPIFLPYALLHKLDAASSFSGTGNALPVVGVSPQSSLDAPIAGQLLWRKLDVPYRLLPGEHQLFGADTVVTIEAGTRLELDDAAIDAHEGALRAVGTVDQPIVFTGATATPGAWRGLYFRSVHEENLLEHVELRFAGGNGFQGQHSAIVVTGTSTTPGSLTLRDSLVADSAGSAVRLYGGGVFVDDDNTYQDNAGGDVVTP